MVYCAAVNCKNGSKKNENLEEKISLFSFPKDEKLRKAWTDTRFVERIGTLKFLQVVLESLHVSQNLSVLHAIGWTASRVRLNPDAIADIFNYAGNDDNKRKEPKAQRAGAFAKRRCFGSFSCVCKPREIMFDSQSYISVSRKVAAKSPS